MLKLLPIYENTTLVLKLQPIHEDTVLLLKLLPIHDNTALLVNLLPIHQVRLHCKSYLRCTKIQLAVSVTADPPNLRNLLSFLFMT